MQASRKRALRLMLLAFIRPTALQQVRFGAKKELQS
jgi:hypothetical protein